MADAAGMTFVLPAPAGMSPGSGLMTTVAIGAPRSRGDEPTGRKMSKTFFKCSPLPRG